MDLSVLANKGATTSLTNEIFAKRDILSKAGDGAKTSRRKAAAEAAAAAVMTHADKKKAKAAAGNEPNSAIAGKKTAGATTTTTPHTPVEPQGKKRKKHLSHKTDPVDRNEQRRTVFVGNLPNTITHQQVEKWFAQQTGAEVEAARLRCVRLAPLQEGEKDRGRGVRILRGEIDKSDTATATAYVVFSDLAGAQKALSLTGSVFKGRHLSITHESPEAKAFAPRSSVYMGNMPYDATDEEVWSFFIDQGLPDVTRVRVIREPATGRGKGFGYVEFATRESVVKAMKLKQPQLKGRTVRIFSVQKSRDPEIQTVHRRDMRGATPVVAGSAAAAAGVKAAPAGKKKEKKKAAADVVVASAAAATSMPDTDLPDSNHRRAKKSATAGAADDSAATAEVKPDKRQQKKKQPALATMSATERPSWMGVTADPRKKLSKDLRWLTQSPHDRKAAAKARHKDRMKAQFIKRKKDAKAE